MTDDPGILGHLPRSRPGRRSERRERPTGAAGRGAAGAGRAPASESAPKDERGSGGRSTLSPSGGRAGAERRPAAGEAGTAPSAASDDLIGGAARAAGQAATAGLAIASRLAGGALRRLPRP